MLIAVDHGNKQIKTVHTPPFTSGLIQSDTPGFGTDALAYRGKYYTLTDQRIPYRRDKTEDERFFILTLFAIAHEIEAMGQYSGSLMRVQLAVGLPPAHFGVQAKRFINYFNGRGAVAFQFKGKPYAIFIENTACFPQSFSAAAATVKNLASFPRALVVDIGGFTADYVRLRNGVPDMAACDSLENGVILLYNRICAKANAELDILLEESEIDRILRSEDQDAAPEVIALAEREAQEFINDLLSGLRERMLELKSGKVIFLGGGNAMQQKYGIKDSPETVFKDLTDWSVTLPNGFADYRFNDRDMQAMIAKESVPTYDWLVKIGVPFLDKKPDNAGAYGAGCSAPRELHFSWTKGANLEAPAGTSGTVLMRSLEDAARKVGVKFLLNFYMDELIVDEKGRVVGLKAHRTPKVLPDGTELKSFRSDGNVESKKDKIVVGAKKAVVLATAGYTDNVTFRR